MEVLKNQDCHIDATFFIIFFSMFIRKSSLMTWQFMKTFNN